MSAKPEKYVFYKCCNCNTINFNEDNDNECVSCGSSEHNTDLINHYISLDTSLIEDTDMLDWISDNSDEELLITSVDEECGYVWVDNCPYAIPYDCICYIHG